MATTSRNNMHFMNPGERKRERERDNISNSKLVPTDDVYTMMKISLFKRRSYVVNERLYICIGHTMRSTCIKKGGQVVSAVCVSFIAELTDKNEKSHKKKRAKATTQLTTLKHTSFILRGTL